MDRSELELRLNCLELGALQTANAYDLVDATPELSLPAEITQNAYDGGLSLHWAQFEIAIFEDRFETYRFADDGSKINHWPRSPNEPLDGAMLAEISKADS